MCSLGTDLPIIYCIRHRYGAECSQTILLHPPILIVLCKGSEEGYLDLRGKDRRDNFALYPLSNGLSGGNVDLKVQSTCMVLLTTPVDTDTGQIEFWRMAK